MNGVSKKHSADWETQLKTTKNLKAIDGLKTKNSEQIETIYSAPALLLRRAFEGGL